MKLLLVFLGLIIPCLCFGQLIVISEDLIKANKVKTVIRITDDQSSGKINISATEKYDYDPGGYLVKYSIYRTPQDSVAIAQTKLYYDRFNQVIKVVYIQGLKDTTVSHFDPTGHYNRYLPEYLDHGGKVKRLSNGLPEHEEIGKIYIDYRYSYY